MDENKADFKQSLQQLIQKLHDLMGSEFLTAFPQTKTQALIEFFKK